MGLYKRCKCGERIEMGKAMCAECQEKQQNVDRERYRQYKDHRKDQEEQRIYKTKRWEKLRERVMYRDHYLCQLCLYNEEIQMADTVHHIEPIKDGGKVYEKKNLIALCDHCHKHVHKAYKTSEKEKIKEKLIKIVDPPRL